MLLRIDENLTCRERRIFRDLSFGEFLHFERQHIRHPESFARLKALPVFAGIQFLDIRLR